MSRRSKYYAEEMTYKGKVFGVRICRGEFGFGGSIRTYTAAEATRAITDFNLTGKQAAYLQRIQSQTS